MPMWWEFKVRISLGFDFEPEEDTNEEETKVKTEDN